MRREDFTPDAPGTLLEITTPRGETGTAFLPLDLPITIPQAPGLARHIERAGTSTASAINCPIHGS
jgi:hypothetical protein